MSCIHYVHEFVQPLTPTPSLQRPVISRRALGCCSTCTASHTALPLQFVEFTRQEPLDLRSQLFTAAGADAMDLMLKLLVLYPARRLSAQAALQHEYFTNAPAAAEPSALSLPIPDERKGLTRKREADDAHNPAKRERPITPKDTPRAA
eukprot:TRINITY_DN1430_c0_g1_i3.p1 TRINITY_DN1430_c0_g1~~TRINITY_DN1430_c0_g1_i3.p1  ORF type:complete len:149 (-),score=19.87 TRINITY_DN1430_c0_g1_i3:47-493(-)